MPHGDSKLNTIFVEIVGTRGFNFHSKTATVYKTQKLILVGYV